MVAQLPDKFMSSNATHGTDFIMLFIHACDVWGPHVHVVYGGPHVHVVYGGPHVHVMYGGYMYMLCMGGPHTCIYGGGPHVHVMHGGPHVHVVYAGRPHVHVMYGGPHVHVVYGGPHVHVMYGGPHQCTRCTMGGVYSQVNQKLLYRESDWWYVGLVVQKARKQGTVC